MDVWKEARSLELKFEEGLKMYAHPLVLRPTKTPKIQASVSAEPER